MVNQKQQRNYFKKRIKNIRFHLHAFCLSKNVEELHQLRVEIKKVNALLHFSCNCSKQKHLDEQLNPLKEVFEHAGLIRNVHISLQLTKGIANKKFIDQQNLLKQSEWEKLADKYYIYKQYIKHLYKNILPLFQTIKNKQSAKWFRNELNKATKKLKHEPVDPHTARKKIKRMLYMDKLHHSPMAINKPFLKQLEDDISNWHDIAYTMHILKPEHTTRKNAGDKLKATQSELNFSIAQSSKIFKQKAVIKK